ncbi:MAG: GGDEF domain-containing protein [Proteobacteria bacterium]|nr:GGDEF domain-containing protein [Pseudomonadota bacterium]
MPAKDDPITNTERHTVVEATRPLVGTTRPRLVVVSGMLLGLQMDLGDAPIVVGRASDCAIAIPHPSVSRNHCRFWREDGAFWIEDLGSTNHTYLNGVQVTRAQLRDGDQIGVGGNAIKFFVGASLDATYHAELIDLAIYDSLTGFFNRRHFCAVLDEELAKTADGAPLSVLIVDLDLFKQINDRHGHPVGDQVLATVARVMRERTPGEFVIGRLGGEEFAVLLPGQLREAAANLAETLRAAVAAHPVEAAGLALPITVSIGVAQADAHERSRGHLLKLADDQLYRAKQEGRNRVCVAA